MLLPESVVKAQYKRWFHGTKTEVMNPDQLSLFEETKDEDLGCDGSVTRSSR